MKKQFHQYQHPAVAIDLVVFGYAQKQLSVLLLNRKDAPFNNGWTLPGVFFQMNETFQDVCLCVLDSKLRLSNLFLEQLYSFDR